MRCSNCGELIEEGSPFCNNCGTSVGTLTGPKSVPEAPVKVISVAQPTPPPDRVPNSLPLTQEALAEKTVSSRPQASKPGTPPWAVALAVAVFSVTLVTALTIFWYYNHDSGAREFTKPELSEDPASAFMPPAQSPTEQVPQPPPSSAEAPPVDSNPTPSQPLGDDTNSTQVSAVENAIDIHKVWGTETSTDNAHTKYQFDLRDPYQFHVRIYCHNIKDGSDVRIHVSGTYSLTSQQISLATPSLFTVEKNLADGQGWTSVSATDDDAKDDYALLSKALNRAKIIEIMRATAIALTLGEAVPGSTSTTYTDLKPCTDDQILP